MKRKKIFEIKGLKFAYDKNKNHIFKDVDLTISKSEKLVFLAEVELAKHSSKFDYGIN